MEKGYFITIEGTDGTGKTTQMNLIKSYFEGIGFEVVLTREPGGTNISEKIRSLILDTANKEMDNKTEMLLYAASRAQLVAEVIKPAVESGKIVICDRFVDSSYVYQGFGRGIDLKIIADINRVALDGMVPDMTFFINLSPEVALSRRMNTSIADRIEKENMTFHMRVYNGYKKLAILYPDRIKSIDGSKSIDQVFNEIKAWLNELID